MSGALCSVCGHDWPFPGCCPDGFPVEYGDVDYYEEDQP